MGRAAKRRRFLRWRKFRWQCETVTGQSVPFTIGMAEAWIRARYRVREGKFYTMPPWRRTGAPIGDWEKRRWAT